MCALFESSVIQEERGPSAHHGRHGAFSGSSSHKQEGESTLGPPPPPSIFHLRLVSRAAAQENTQMARNGDQAEINKCKQRGGGQTEV